jgi:hypothetical protein
LLQACIIFHDLFPVEEWRFCDLGHNAETGKMSRFPADSPSVVAGAALFVYRGMGGGGGGVSVSVSLFCSSGELASQKDAAGAMPLLNTSTVAAIPKVKQDKLFLKNSRGMMGSLLCA